MVAVSLTVLVAVLLINTLSSCSAENVYCVTPTATSCSSCPHNNHCATLSEYAQEDELYFTSNTTMLFLPGDHVLDVNITVANVSRLTMRGESSSDNIATVVPNGSVGFSFTNMVDLNIYSLAFTSYNRSWSYGSHPASNSALLLQSTQNAELVNCSFHDNIGTALTVHNTNITLIGNNEFVHNQCGCESFNERCKLGCGVTAFNSNLIFAGNNIFLKNRHNNVGVSKVGAGAIFAVASSLHFSGVSNFIDNVKSTKKKQNHAHGGGAIYVTNNTVVSFHGTNNFINNSANNKGGAIYTSHNTVLTFIGTSNFTSNYVYRGRVIGGAIYTHGNAVLTFNGTNNFIKNSANNGGGAIYAETNSSLRFKGTSNFSHNSAYINGGGAIFTKDNGVLTFNGTSNFINNSANDFGGAIYAGTNTLLTFIGTSIFSDNSAHWVGGAIYIEINVVHNLNGTNNFTHNSAGYYGGAISTYDNADNVLIFSGTNNFIGNSVQRHGGGAISTSSAVLTFTGTSNFINNSANGLFSDGGAISTSPFGNAVLTFTGINNFINNSAEWYGGAIYAESYSSLRFKGNFSHDSAYVHGGGAIFTEDNAVLGTSNFINNSALDGGAIYAGTNTLLMLIGTSIFSDNSAHRTGGAIYTKINVVLNLKGTNNFTHNSARYNGGAINTDDNADNVLIFSGTNNFIGNSVQRHGGGAISTSSAVLTFTGTNNFINNSANGLFSYGGAINTSPLGNAVLIFNGTNNFTSNSAILYGGVISTDFNTSLTFIGTIGFSNNSAGYNGGAISADFNTYSLTFIGTTGFSNNTANRDGGAIYAETKTLLKFIGISDFITNKAPSGGAISTRDNVIITITGTISFISNSAMKGGAISANRNSKLTFDGHTNFTNSGHDNTNAVNRDSYGGAIYLALNSTFSIFPHTTVCWVNNHATLGGAIYVSDINPLIYCTQIAQYIAAYVPREECFFQLPGQNLSNGIDANIFFKNNSADNAGSVLYGGTIDNCKLHLSGLDPYYSSGDVFNMLFQYEDDTNSTTSKISSDPLHICVCKNNLPNCRRSRYNIPYPVYPGELFQLFVPIVTVGQRSGTVFSTVRSTAITDSIDSHPVHLLDYQYLQQTNNTCTKLNYTVFSLSRKVLLVLHPEGSPCSKHNGGALHFVVTINQTCPPGFNISESAKSCVCEPRLAQYTNQCNITNGVGRITRESNKQFWVGYDNLSHELILQPQCHFDYCVKDTVVFPLNNTDVQCTYNMQVRPLVWTL